MLKPTLLLEQRGHRKTLRRYNAGGEFSLEINSLPFFPSQTSGLPTRTSTKDIIHMANLIYTLGVVRIRQVKSMLAKYYLKSNMKK